MSNIDINDVVEIITLDDVNEAKKNLVGTVVFVFGDPEKHYEIEITDSEGRTIETLTLPESSLRKIWPQRYGKVKMNNSDGWAIKTLT